MEKNAYKVNSDYRRTQPITPPAIVPGPLGGW
jgi:hypothetical protein